MRKENNGEKLIASPRLTNLQLRNWTGLLLIEFHAVAEVHIFQANTIIPVQPADAGSFDFMG